MVSPSAKTHSTRLSRNVTGFSLVELMVASFISLLVISVLGSVFIASQKHAVNRHQNTLLAYALDSIINEIKREVRRAGYKSAGSGTVELNENSLTLSYQISAPEDPLSVRLVSYEADLKSGKLKVCDRTVNTRDVHACSRYFSVLDEKSIALTDFNFEKQTSPLQPEVALYSLSLTVGKKGNSGVTKTRKVDVLARN